MHQLLTSHASYVDISDVVDASVESSTSMPDYIIIPGDEPSESITLYLSVAYDETSRQIAICNHDYKFVAFPHNFLQEFANINEVRGMIHSGIVRTLHS